MVIRESTGRRTGDVPSHKHFNTNIIGMHCLVATLQHNSKIRTALCNTKKHQNKTNKQSKRNFREKVVQ